MLFNDMPTTHNYGKSDRHKSLYGLFHRALQCLGWGCAYFHHTVARGMETPHEPAELIEEGEHDPNREQPNCQPQIKQNLLQNHDRTPLKNRHT